MLKENMTDKAKFIPKAGFNVVGVDEFEMPGDQLYLVGHFVDEKAAKAALAKFKKANQDEQAYIYGPETR